jgi:DNA polymerase sigma
MVSIWWMVAQIHQHFKANSFTTNNRIVKVMESRWDLQIDVAFKQWCGLVFLIPFKFYLW